MKKIWLIATMTVLYSSCSILQGKKSVTDHESIAVFGFSKPLSEQFPGTDITLKNPGGKTAKFQLVEMVDAEKQKKLVYLSEETIGLLRSLIKADVKDLAQLQFGTKTEGIMLMAESLGQGSVLSRKQMRQMDQVQRRVATAYETDEKYIVWVQVPVRVTGTVTKEGIVPDLPTTGTNVQPGQSEQQWIKPRNN